MILLGCFLAFGLAVAPRVFLVLAWILSERWVRVWQGEFLIPLLGIIFLPYTTIMYMLVWTPRGIEGHPSGPVRRTPDAIRARGKGGIAAGPAPR